MQSESDVRARLEFLETTLSDLKAKMPKLLKERDKQINLYRMEMLKTSIYELNLILNNESSNHNPIPEQTTSS